LVLREARGMELVHPRYVASEVLGRGAEGIVLRVRDRENPTRPLVAKVLARGVDHARLEGEFALLARLRVPGLVRAHDLARDAESGAPFLVEDFVDGPDAIAFVAANDRVRRLGTLLLSVARTLDGLHSAGFVHGDLKPAHVRVQGAVRVLDLGAAVAPGFTRAYAAPEVVAGERSSVASDLYGLGATIFAAATGAPPSGSALRAIAPWVPPSLADVVDRLLRPHPRDRFASAREVVAAIAGSVPDGDVAGTTLIGRDREIALLSRAIEAPGALYVVGPAGVGKSHLAREVAMQALLSGREVRQLSASDPHPRLIAFLRGGEWAFEGASHRALLVIDDLERGAPELASAIEAFRCLSRREGPTGVATAPRAPDGAPAIEVGPLGGSELAALCRAIEIPEAEIAEAARTSEGLPGWLLAARGRIPLTRAAATLRLEGASEHARSLLAVVALLGGRAKVATCRAIVPRAAENELFSRALLERGPTYEASFRLSSPSLARELAEASATPTLIERVSEAALRDETPAATLLSLASVSTRRVALLEAAADRARAAEERAIEIGALTMLGEQCDGARLRRLERLARDTGDAALHERVLGWLDRSDDPSVRPLACTRKAERAGRAGDHARAEALVDEGLAAASALGDELAIAWCEATRGTVALYRADWVSAEAALGSARARLSTFEAVEREELARLDHNLGVVALYRGDARAAADAFERALRTKRALGDLPGVRASLLNLGLACTRLHELDRAETILTEALALARSLGERVGRAWTLAALAELHVRRGSSREGERFVAEAEALGDAVPQAIRADLALLRAEIALLEGDAPRARAAIAECDPALRAEDALVDGRARTLEARAILASLPADRRKAARTAIEAIRLARRAGMPEIEAQARAVLLDARKVHTSISMSEDDPESILWRSVEALASCEDAEAAVLVARAALESSGAERAFVARVSPAPEGTRVLEAWGVDAEGFPLASAIERVPQDLVEMAVRASGPLHQKSGKGARVAIAHRGTVVIVEHRYLPHAFDRLAESTARRWATLSRFVRAPKTVVRAPTVTVRAPSVTELHETTVVPTVESRRDFPGILGESPALRRSLAKLEAALDGELPVLVVGETGVGKELFARALHEEGPRARAPFVAVNCAAIPDSLFEAELFGHVRGSFTGADRGRGGLAGRAKNGTLFLDEVGELPLARQATLLRVLETRRFRPVGSDEELPLEARVVTATNRDLAREVENGTFRRDLLYRLDVVTIRVPPLRERTGDIARLARHYLGDAELTGDAVDALEGYAWPGNVRELAHVMQRLSMLKLPVIERGHLPREIRSAPAAKKARPTQVHLDERGEVEQALAAEAGNITRAAARLGLTRHGLKKRMVRLGMRTARSGGDS
jgi:DNA-binding NtrC family response regulator